MANPSKENSQFADENGKPLLGTRQSLVADATSLAITYTANDPATAADGAVTFADGTVLAAATVYEAFDEVEALLSSHATKINAILDILEAHGLMSDA